MVPGRTILLRTNIFLRIHGDKICHLNDYICRIGVMIGRLGIGELMLVVSRISDVRLAHAWAHRYFLWILSLPWHVSDRWLVSKLTTTCELIALGEVHRDMFLRTSTMGSWTVPGILIGDGSCLPPSRRVFDPAPNPRPLLLVPINGRVLSAITELAVPYTEDPIQIELPAEIACESSARMAAVLAAASAAHALARELEGFSRGCKPSIDIE
jgi:hypothetical protein